MGRHGGSYFLQQSSLPCPPAVVGGRSGRHGGTGFLLQSILRWAPASHQTPACHRAPDAHTASTALLQADVAVLSHPCACGASLVPAACRLSITVQPREQDTSCCLCCMLVTFSMVALWCCIQTKHCKVKMMRQSSSDGCPQKLPVNAKPQPKPFEAPSAAARLLATQVAVMGAKDTSQQCQRHGRGLTGAQQSPLHSPSSSPGGRLRTR